MPINLGSGAITAAKIGSTDVSKIMLGVTEVYSAAATGVTVPWTLASPSFEQTYNPSIASPTAVQVSDDGSKLYIQDSRTIRQFSLSSAFDISTASLATSYTLTNGSETVGFVISDSGTKLFSVFPNGGSGPRAFVYNLSTAWDVSTASWNSGLNSYLPSSSGFYYHRGIAIKSDGSALYLAASNGTTSGVYKYTLGTAWNTASNVTYDGFFDFSAQDVNVEDVTFKSDGTKMFVAGNANDSIYEYDLSTAWDIATASYTRGYSVSSQETSPLGVAMSSTGEKMYVSGSAAGRVHQYNILNTNPQVPDQVAGANAIPGDTTLNLSWTAPASDAPVTDYIIEYTPSGGSATTVQVGSAATSYQLTSLTNGTQYSIRVAAISSVGTGAYSAAITATPAVPTGITPNTDNRARFYLPAGATSLTVGATSSTGYYRLFDGTNYGAVAGSNYHTAAHYMYAYMTTATISGLTGTPVVQLLACDAAGNPTGSIQAISLTGGSQAVDAVDISGLGTLVGFAAYSSAAYSGNNLHYGMNSGSSTLPGTITEIRAQSTNFGWATQIPPNSTTNPPLVYYYGGGLDITDQDLDATALDQLYADLGTTSNSGTQLVVRLNPGTSGDTPTIATTKNYSVYGT